MGIVSVIMGIVSAPMVLFLRQRFCVCAHGICFLGQYLGPAMFFEKIMGRPKFHICAFKKGVYGCHVPWLAENAHNGQRLVHGRIVQILGVKHSKRGHRVIAVEISLLGNLAPAKAVLH